MCIVTVLCFAGMPVQKKPGFENQIAAVLRKQIMQEAAWAMQQEPVTVTAAASPRSAGGKHDFYSEGD